MIHLARLLTGGAFILTLCLLFLLLMPIVKFIADNLMVTLVPAVMIGCLYQIGAAIMELYDNY